MKKEPKLIILRGPSGSGKTTVARAVHEEQRNNGNLMAWIEQDYFRRIVLKEKDLSGGFYIQFIRDMVLYLLKNGHDVILEGIFVADRCEEMFKEIIESHPAENFFFYFDISLKETIRRHNTKSNKDAFGEKELKAWYRDKDFLICIKEKIIQENEKAEDIAERIKLISGLKS